MAIPQPAELGYILQPIGISMAFENAGKGSVEEAEKVAIPELVQAGKDLLDYASNTLKNLLIGKRVVISIEDKP